MTRNLELAKVYIRTRMRKERAELLPMQMGSEAKPTATGNTRQSCGSPTTQAQMRSANIHMPFGGTNRQIV